VNEPAKKRHAMTSPLPVTHLLYLHGFRSSPQSFKARRIAAWLAAHRPGVVWHCPQLPPSPEQAMHDVLAHVAAWPRATTGIVGSSLGGFYARVVAERLGAQPRAVLLNPAINPARDLAGQVGEIESWHDGTRLHFRPEDVAALRELGRVVPTHPERYFAIIAKGDELLDWREMTAGVGPCRVKLLEGGDHALSDFELHLPDVLAFLALA